jgi:DNA-binding GntR family transcriptional regulator
MANETSAAALLLSLSSRSSLVAEAIRDAILRGVFPPGSELVERNLATMFGISKTPVREALISLARSGLITMVPNRGATVPVLDSSALHSIYEMRLLLEPRAVRNAAASFPSQALDRARTALREAKDAIDREDRVELTLANRRFHRLLYSHCGNPRIVSALDDLQDQLALVAVSLLWPKNPTWSAEFREHQAILTAVAKEDGALVEKLVTKHVERAFRNINADQ